MGETAPRKNLLRMVVGLAAIPVATGTLLLLLGSAIIPEGSSTTASVESELRFYAVWWIGAGLFLGSLAPRIEYRGPELRAVCGLLVLGGVGRALAVADAGWPHPFFTGLMVLEFLLPPVLVLWQAWASSPSLQWSSAACSG